MVCVGVWVCAPLTLPISPGDAVLLVPRDAQVTRPLPCGHDEAGGRVEGLLAALVSGLRRWR